MKYLIIFLIISFPAAVNAQRLHLDLYGGAANYQGDLQQKRFTLAGSKPAVGVGFSYDVSPHVIARVAGNYMKIAGDDNSPSNDKSLAFRNLRFTSVIKELQLGLEYNLFSLEERSATPYVFGSIALFHFDPYTNTDSGNKVFLRDFGTEGQGLPQYPDKKLYSNNQFSIPFGFGVKVILGERIQVGAELGFRKLFTDYLDDVSGNYADSAALAGARGILATELAYRGAGPHPADGTMRGNAKLKDWYYTTGIKLSYKLGGYGGGKRGEKKLGCPTNVF